MVSLKKIDASNIIDNLVRRTKGQINLQCFCKYFSGIIAIIIGTPFWPRPSRPPSYLLHSHSVNHFILSQ
jgi:hypothetical protein